MSFFASDALSIPIASDALSMLNSVTGVDVRNEFKGDGVASEWGCLHPYHEFRFHVVPK